MVKFLIDILEGIKELIYPTTCLICNSLIKNKESLDKLICKTCLLSLEKNLPPFCSRCGRHISSKDLRCKSCGGYNFAFDSAFSPLKYDEKIKKIIWDFKYNQREYLGITLSKFLIEFIKEYKILQEIDCIIPIPLYRTKLREREFNQAEILARPIADEFKKELILDVLFRKIPTKTQTDLNEEERFQNVKEAFLVKNHYKIKNKNILLVDDVLTTGATASSASLSLKNAGAKKIFVLTLAS